MGGLLFFFVAYSCVCLFVYCLLVRYFLQTLEPTGFKSFRSGWGLHKDGFGLGLVKIGVKTLPYS